MRKCKVCGKSVRSDNSVGVCSRTAECKREYQRLRSVKAGDPLTDRSERYCEAIEDFRDWCVRHGKGYRTEAIAALHAHTKSAR